MEKLYRIEEVAIVLGCSTKTIGNWYAFKRKSPEHPIAQMIPEFIQKGSRQTRYWTEESVLELAKVKKQIPKGRNGVMACVTQKYQKKKEVKNEKENNRE